MSTESRRRNTRFAWLAVLSMAAPGVSLGQVPVDESGVPIGETTASSEAIPLLSAAELEELVGPIALYPDDLLAIVLPATTYPLQLVQADRFLQDLKSDSSLEPDEAWDDSIVALLNYPEAIELLTSELDQTWRLGEAVVAQQADVVAAIESFRDKAYAAGNLKSDTHQTVSQTDGVIEITPVEEDVIYVPYYEPERVVVYQPSPVYYYYPRAYPVYYYPYPYGHSFRYGFFWGVTTAFTVGWFSDSLHVYHHSYHGHPYYGHHYGYNYWYRQPSIHVHNNYYYSKHHNYYSGDRYKHGDYWRPHSGSTVGHHDQRVTRSRHYPGRRGDDYGGGGNGNGHGGGGGGNGGGDFEERQSQSSQSRSTRRQSSQQFVGNSSNTQSDIKFRQRSATTSNQASAAKPERDSAARPSVKFRERPEASPKTVASNRSAQPSRGAEPARSNRPSNTNRTAPRSNAPVKSTTNMRSSAPVRSSQSQRSSQAPRVNKPARASQPQRASQPSRSSQPSRASKPKMAASSSGSNKAPGAAASNRDRGSSRRR